MYQHPGVYIEHVPSNRLSIEAASTSVTAFIGHLTRGKPLQDGGAPEQISLGSQYAQKYGPISGGSGGIRDLGDKADTFGYAVTTFLANGGSKAFIVPVCDKANKGKASKASITIKDGAKKYKLDFTATSTGKWADALLINLKQEDTGDFTLKIGTQTTASLSEADVTKKEFDTILETFSGLSVVPTDGRAIKGQVNDRSALVTVESDAGSASGAGDKSDVNAVTTGGEDSKAPKKADFEAAFETLKDYRSVSIMVLPGLNWKDNKEIYQSAITHAEFMQNRMVLVDPVNPDTTSNQLVTAKNVKDAGFPTSPYSALYYPYLTVSNPFYDAETAANKPATFDIGPSAMAAGLWGRIDAARGVWKAPAGLEATVRGSLGPNVMIGNAIQDNLNEWGVNCLRAIIGPTVVWGGRTLATKTKPQYRYIPVRRTQSMIGESLYNALQAVVFEPNDHKLWASLRASIGNFMDGLHRSGAFQGEKASDAYFVNCGLGSTMTQGDIDAGIVRVVVGFAPLKPAEFVVVQIQQIVGQAA
ncbi:phage tail sheath family protein [Kordiimonas marina]|uniref:phage tail sheath family protein n=1 Tax=Kordiimonas marina TaxID=2872312 RepID=UPI001FF1DDF1|nr:phage tail sheath C-terminal domain-containing protein [Kordiimonas marina]MCJ9429323.1 phage tail sheath subtilisin-like domain-containing protein [Kordiimonas marina]